MSILIKMLTQEMNVSSENERFFRGLKMQWMPKV